MALTIEIWRSVSGLSDAAFALLTTLTDTGGAFTFTDPDVVPGQLYIYRARRRDDSKDPDEQYSAWSPLAFARGAYPSEIVTMSCDLKTLTGVQTALYVAVEACEGIPTKAAWRVPYLSGGMTADHQTVYSRALSNAPTMNKEAVRGRFSCEGQFVIEVKPEGATPRLLLATFPVETTALTSPTRYRHRFPNKFGSRSVTLIHQIGDFYYVYPGVKGSSIEFTVNKEQDSVIQATISFMALDELVYEKSLVPTVETLLGISTASSDPLPPYSAAIGLATINALEAGVRQITFGASKNLGANDPLWGGRGPKKHFERMTEITASANLFYQDNTNVRREMGVTNPTGAYAPGQIIITAPVSVTLAPANNLGGYSNIFTLALPNAQVKSTRNVDGTDEIPEALTFTALDLAGDAAATDFYAELTNGESNAQLIAPGAAILTVPASSTRPYLYGVADGTPTSTVIAASGAAHLSAVDDYYNGKSLKVVSGAQAGNSRVITDYVAATKTFTVGSAFAAAPVAGDIFEIVD